ncbi:diguanylate cyclase [Shewanella sp. Scap07]|uniref:diguanylate cyclase n=1 Tax=Shewanella sp. Scap07 TaxID=2589987 RepID=UPI00211919B4|nr:diguanylate cyclase [Shewanella sp. Scap07]
MITKQKQSKKTMPKVHLSRLKFTILLGLIGLVINLYPIPLFGNAQLIVGNAAYVIVAILLGPWYALLAATMTSIGLFIAWQSWHIFVLFSIQALWLGFARRKDIYSLYADIAFWLIVGMPLFYGYVVMFSDMPGSHLTFVTLKQAINGIFCTSLGSLLVTFIPQLWQWPGKIADSQSRPFNAQLTYTFTQILTMALICSALLFNNYFIDNQQVHLKRNLEDTATQIGIATNKYIAHHQTAINNAASWLSLSSQQDQQWQNMLSRMHQNYPSFITMLMANADGNINAASPISRLNQQKIAKGNINISDRDYFHEAFYNQRSYVSPVFQGRGFGSDPIVAISAPIYQQNQVVGIIEGSLNLNNFGQFDIKHGVDGISMVIIDNDNRVIYASPELGMAALSSFTYSLSGENYKTILQMINFGDIDNQSPEYVFTQFGLDNGWSLYTVKPFSPLLKLLETQYLSTFAVLVISLIITVFLIQTISQRLTRPLELIAKKFSEKRTDFEDEAVIIEAEVPLEIQALHSSIRQSKRQLISYQLELEEKVAIRTFELEKANTMLKSLAERDDLTGLYNRRYAEQKFASIQEMCQRTDEAMTLAIIDIDHFKDINDSHGHLVGDEAIRILAKQMLRSFKRDTDMVSRYGGEEFLLILPLCNVLKVEAHLNQFKQQVAALSIPTAKDDKTISMTISIGAVMGNASYSKDLEDWFKIADRNLYHAKSNGRNRVVTSMQPDAPLQVTKI